MRLLPIVLVLVAAVLVSAGCRTTVRERYPNGNPRKEGQLLDGEQDGLWSYYHENGNLKSRGSYVHDKQVGPWVQYFPSGEKETEGQFVDRRRHGVWRFYHRVGGHQRAMGELDRGRQTGLWTFWSSRGEKEQSGEFSNDKQVLRWIYWHPNGSKRAEGYFLDGTQVGTWVTWDASGNRTDKVYPMPAGYEMVRDVWPDLALRREGFLRDGVPVGHWVSWHANGQRRLAGDFESGKPHGTWRAWTADGAPLATGPVTDGLAGGAWRIFGAGGEQVVEVEGMAPAAPTFGEWSPATLASEAPAEEVVAVWLSEIASPVDAAAIVSREEMTSSATPTPGDVAAGVVSAPVVPIRAQEWTVREEQNLESYTRAYGMHPPAKGGPAGRYGPRTTGDSGRAPDGDREKAELLIGKALPLTRFDAADGIACDLDELKGKKNVLAIILRGFAGEVCVYCVTQTGALTEDEAQQAFAKLDTEVVIVYPGPLGGIDAFLESYHTTFGQTQSPGYRILYDPDMALVGALGLRGDLAIPTALLMDKTGTVRWAYVGSNIADRPSAKTLVEAVRGIAQ